MSNDSYSPTEPVGLPNDDTDDFVLAKDFWNETEDLIKEAEQINGAMIVPAISELRYGGRKLIDYLDSISCPDPKVRQAHLADFLQCCIRARHDAVDAIVSYIALYLEELERSVSADLIERAYPDYVAFKVLLFEAAKLIAESRKDRIQRNVIYSKIKTEYVSRIIEGYSALSKSRSSIFAEQETRDKKQHTAAFVLAASISALSAVILGTVLYAITQ